jgi:hypothetical protein
LPGVRSAESEITAEESKRVEQQDKVEMLRQSKAPKSQ